MLLAGIFLFWCFDNVEADMYCGSGYTCPSWQQTGLIKITGCTPALPGWGYCLETPSYTGSGTCSGYTVSEHLYRCDIGGSGKYDMGGCDIHQVKDIYGVVTGGWCSTKTGVNISVDCCYASGPETATCNQSCASATCEEPLSCTSGVCRNPGCPGESDCDCGGGPTPSCSVTVTGTNPVSTGGTGSYTATVSMTDSTATGITMTLGDSTYTSSSVAGTNTVDLTAPSTPGTYTVTANVTGTSSVSCSGSLSVTVANPQVTVTARACNSTDMMTCAACDVPVGFTGSFRLGATSHAVSSNNLASFTNVDGGTAASVIELSTTDPDWTLIGAAKLYAAGTWPTDGATYGPYNYCVTKNHDPWWQVIGGDAYARKVSVVSTPGILSLMTNYVGNPVSSGVLAAATTINKTKAIIGPEDRSWAVESSRYTTPPKEGFQYFVRSFELGSAPAEDTLEPSGALPTDTPANTGKDVYYLHTDVSIDSPLVIPAGTSLTYLIDGSLNIDADITVAQGGFLALISSGPITITGNVSQLQGIYITNDTFSVADGIGSGAFVGTNSRRLEVEGTVAAWSGVSLLRDLGGINNNSNPAVTFTYRPDFLINLPWGFKHNGIQWREVAP